MFNHAKLPEIKYKIPVYYNVLCNNIFVRTWIFLCTSFGKQETEPFEPLEQIVRGSVVCQGMSASF